MDASQTVLSVNNLQVSAGSNPLVKGISFEIKQGEIFALVGESGSGKSLTVLKITSGEVLFGQQKIFELTETQMNSVRGKKIAMIFQEPQTSLNPVQTVGVQLQEVLKLHQNINATDLQTKLVSLLEEVGIPEPEARLKWYPHQLSGGQKQRVMIAMALACEPELLVADEPTTALDVTIQRQILDLLNDLRKTRNLSVLLITHDMGVVAEMADTVAVMQKGELLEQADCKTFFDNPQHEYSKRLINSLPKADDFIGKNDNESLLEVNDLKVWFAKKKGILQRTVGHTKAVDGVSFKVNKGETLAIVGESGSQVKRLWVKRFYV